MERLASKIGLKPGPKPKGNVKIKWSADFAYAIGLIATDGCLYGDGRHVNLTSKDIDQINNFQESLGTSYHIGRKGNGSSPNKKYYVVQIGDVLFFNFLMSIGLTPAKSKTLGKIAIPDEYFFDFFRGSFDGDGCTYSYWDPRWKSSFMFYTVFVSASEAHIIWLRSEINRRLGLVGHINKSKKNPCYQLKYAKRESLVLLRKIYYSPKVRCLSRKRLKIKQMLAIVGESLG